MSVPFTVEENGGLVVGSYTVAQASSTHPTIFQLTFSGEKLPADPPNPALSGCKRWVIEMNVESDVAILAGIVAMTLLVVKLS